MKTLCLDRLLPHLGVRQPRCAPDPQGNKDEGAVNGIKEVKFFCFTLGSICEDIWKLNKLEGLVS